MKFFYSKDFAMICICAATQFFVIIPFLNAAQEERTTKKFQKELVEKGFAEYDPVTGEWRYKKCILSEPKASFPKKIQEDFSDLDRIAVVPDRFPVARKK